MERNLRKIKQGKVISNKMDKTVTVLVETLSRHKLYQKPIKQSSKFHAHDESGCNIGDMVEIMETRPLSKTKRWRVSKVIEAVKAGE